MVRKRKASKKELGEIIDYWCSLPRGSSYVDEGSLISFLGIFTPRQIKGAMYIAKSTGRSAYFRYLCGILHNWKQALERGEKPGYFDIDE
jgi:hypothetical protein